MTKSALLIAVQTALLVPTASLAQQEPRSSQAASVPSPDAANRPRAAADEVVEITYPEATGPEAAPTGIRMARPYRFSADGFYLWREPDGVWVIQRQAASAMVLSGTIASSGPLEAMSPWLSQVTASTATVLYGPSTQNGTNEAMRFRAQGSHIDFNLLVDGQPDTEKIRLGAKGQPPSFIPFKLKNLPTVARAATASASRKTPPGQAKAPATGSGKGPGKRKSQ